VFKKSIIVIGIVFLALTTACKPLGEDKGQGTVPVVPGDHFYIFTGNLKDENNKPVAEIQYSVNIEFPSNYVILPGSDPLPHEDHQIPPTVYNYSISGDVHGPIHFDFEVWRYLGFDGEVGTLFPGWSISCQIAERGNPTLISANTFMNTTKGEVHAVATCDRHIIL